jgi:hypothetical protein
LSFVLETVDFSHKFAIQSAVDAPGAQTQLGCTGMLPVAPFLQPALFERARFGMPALHPRPPPRLVRGNSLKPVDSPDKIKIRGFLFGALKTIVQSALIRAPHALSLILSHSVSTIDAAAAAQQSGPLPRCIEMSRLTIYERPASRIGRGKINRETSCIKTEARPKRKHTGGQGPMPHIQTLLVLLAAQSGFLTSLPP